MASNSLWFRQDAHELKEPWFFFLSSDARLAWVFLKAYVLEASVSQKRPGIAPALDPAVAAYQWRVAVEAIHELMSAASDAGEFLQDGDEWRVIDPSAFVSERTLAKSDSAVKPSQSTRENAEKDVLQKNDAERCKTGKNAEKVVVRDTDTDTDESPIGDKNNGALRLLENTSPPPFDPHWSEIVAIYPKRSGATNRAKAEDDMRKRWKSLHGEAEAMLAGVRRYAEWCNATGKTGTEMVAQMTTFFNGKRWQEEFEIPDEQRRAGPRSGPENAQQRSDRLGASLGLN